MRLDEQEVSLKYCVFVSLFICLAVCVSVCMRVCLCAFLCVFGCLSVCLCVFYVCVHFHASVLFVYIITIT